MSLQNTYLENEGKNFSAEKRRASWNTEEIIKDPPVNDHPQTLARQLTELMTTFIRPECIESNGEPKKELGLMFTVHKKVLLKLLEQKDCEGLRIYFASKTIDDKVRTNLVLKPVDASLYELDAVKSEEVVMFCESPTECPPETRCPSESFDNVPNT
ncbi:hypothetical protein [Salmonirosea aquatica]|uniref:Uncharacterized protein n=1 Tax=Salmonirosea aquatica TaxID=2654236 RepID=A0A7C9FYD0_9BACT|nr:hypothetical protein [Cytophagaceae bacterium SJW1-29]